MRTGIFLGLLFFLLLCIEHSFIHALFGIIANIPLMLIAGMILMQRIGIEEGIAWLLAVAFFHADTTALFLTVVGPILILQIFTTRSIYALLGFGLTSYAIASGISLLFGEFVFRAFGYQLLFSHPYLHATHEFFLLIPGLIVGILLARNIENSIFMRFTFREST